MPVSIGHLHRGGRAATRTPKAKTVSRYTQSRLQPRQRLLMPAPSTGVETTTAAPVPTGPGALPEVRTGVSSQLGPHARGIRRLRSMAALTAAGPRIG
ncbi:hypothetical protein [Streptomyces sp. MBT84]|uniref:hypothetical protein n=1 Tax=Streptomyces sp. MBT84 TaxID=1488414 RepID=UPI001C6DFAA9|nr:hypothetical protein [Streptomyces sp. MBT84]